MSTQVTVRNVSIGGGAPITIQSMTNVSVTDIQATAHLITRLIDAGCDIVRIAVPNRRSVHAFAQIRKMFDIPLVADIHFDYRLAIDSILAGADKIRINPGNIQKQQLLQVIECAKQHKVAIRVGVNGGSVNKETLEKCGGNKAVALVESLKEYLQIFKEHNFHNVVLSVKSTDVRETVAINKAVSKLGYPMHLGVTEAGLLQQGIVKNSVGIGALLLDGIGDTIRVSLTSDPVDEVLVAKDLLVSLGLRDGVTFVSCPKCGRCSIDLEKIAKQVHAYVSNIKKPLKIAVMGCEVNGPGECKDADLGLAGSNGKFVFFKQGKIYKTVPQETAFEEFTKEIDKLAK